MTDAKVNTGERYMMVNMEYHEALKQQNADLVEVLEIVEIRLDVFKVLSHWDSDDEYALKRVEQALAKAEAE